MRRVAAGFALALTVAAQAAAANPAREPALAIAWTIAENSEQGTLMRVDPVSLDSAPGPAVKLGAWPTALARSPDGRYVAFLDHTAYPRLRIVDTQRMVNVRMVPTGEVLGAAWLRPHRLLVVEEPGLVGVIDPLSRRAIRWRFFQGSVLQWARMEDGLVVLSGPTPRGVGTARLFLISANGTARLVKLPGIAAGSDYERERVEVPALAVDPTGERAVVVSGCLCAAVDVDLRSKAVRLHPLTARRLAKAGSGPVLTAVWLPGDRVAVTGRRLDGHQSSPLGLAVLDNHNWSLRWLDRESAEVRRAGAALLGLGGGRVTVYSVDGTPRFSYPEAWSVSVAGAYAYVRRQAATDVVELATGHVVASARAQLTVLADL